MFGIGVDFLEPDFVWQGLNVQDVHGEEPIRPIDEDFDEDGEGEGELKVDEACELE